MNNLDRAAMIAASGQVLCECLPSDFDTLDDMDVFVKDNAWEPFEHWTVDQLWEHMDSVANTLKDFRKLEVEED